MTRGFGIFLSTIGFLLQLSAQTTLPMRIPLLEKAPTIDGDLSDWKDQAFSDGEWNLDRIRNSSWYDEKKNKLTLHPEEREGDIDLSAVYYMAWDDDHIYFGAEVKDNVNDVEDSKHEPKRWYYKDAIAWFVEAPTDTVPEKFSDGDHGFAFVIDTLFPNYGAWWRHGDTSNTYIEESLGACAYAIVMNPSREGNADYSLEARVDLKATIGKNAAGWAPKTHEVLKLMIVHCDPDGGDYGGHLLIYGSGDDDSSWSEFELTGSKK